MGIHSPTLPYVAPGNPGPDQKPIGHMLTLWLVNSQLNRLLPVLFFRVAIFHQLISMRRCFPPVILMRRTASPSVLQLVFAPWVIKMFIMRGKDSSLSSLAKFCNSARGWVCMNTSADPVKAACSCAAHARIDASSLGEAGVPCATSFWRMKRAFLHCPSPSFKDR